MKNHSPKDAKPGLNAYLCGYQLVYVESCSPAPARATLLTPFWAMIRYWRDKLRRER